MRTGTCSTYGHSLVMQGGRISEVDAQVPPTDAVVINCGGLLLMPGTLTNVLSSSCAMQVGRRRQCCCVLVCRPL